MAIYYFAEIGTKSKLAIQAIVIDKNSIRDAHTSQPGEIVFTTMRYTISDGVQG